jgi:hypothetical protein
MSTIILSSIKKCLSTVKKIKYKCLSKSNLTVNSILFFIDSHVLQTFAITYVGLIDIRSINVGLIDLICCLYFKYKEFLRYYPSLDQLINKLTVIL